MPWKWAYEKWIISIITWCSSNKHHKLHRFDNLFLSIFDEYHIPLAAVGMRNILQYFLFQKRMAKRYGKCVCVCVLCVCVCVCVCNELLIQSRGEWKKIVIEHFNPKINSSTHEDHVIWACWFPVHKCTWKHIKHLNIATDFYRFTLSVSVSLFLFSFCLLHNSTGGKTEMNSLSSKYTVWTTMIVAWTVAYSVSLLRWFFVHFMSLSACKRTHLFKLN